MKKNFLKKFSVLTAAVCCLAAMPSASADTKSENVDIKIFVGETIGIKLGGAAASMKVVTPEIISLEKNKDENTYILSGLSEGMGKIEAFAGEIDNSASLDFFNVSVRFDTKIPHGKGDVNNDAVTDAKDVEILQKYFTRQKTTTQNFMSADMNGDGKVDIFDVVALKRYIKDGPVPFVTTAVTTAVTTTTTTTTTVTAVTTADTTDVPEETTAVTTTPASMQPDDPSEEALAKAEEMLALINEERESLGRKPLKLDPKLVQLCTMRAEEITRHFSHERPDGSKWSTILKEYGIYYTSAAENIAAGNDTVEKAYLQWKNSEGHYSNMMNEELAEFGLGYCYVPDSEYKHYWVQLFTKQ